jgi:hypothetical protein
MIGRNIYLGRLDLDLAILTNRLTNKKIINIFIG